MANKIHPTAIIGDNVILGDNNVIGPYCIIGQMAEHKRCNELGKVVIGDNNVITGLVTIDAGTESVTIIGNGCYIMKHSHIGHDVNIGNDVIISCGAKIGGHCIIEDKANIGLNAVIHQRVTIPEGCMIGASGFVGKKSILRAGYKYAGVPVKELGNN